MSMAPTQSARQATEIAVFLARVDEKLDHVEEINRDQKLTLATIVATQATQQTQLNALSTDVAVLRAQHAGFWKTATSIVTALSLAGAVVGWMVSTFVHH